jgi:hypothetical protein
VQRGGDGGDRPPLVQLAQHPQLPQIRIPHRAPPARC